MWFQTSGHTLTIHWLTAINHACVAMCSIIPFEWVAKEWHDPRMSPCCVSFLPNDFLGPVQTADLEASIVFIRLGESFVSLFYQFSGAFCPWLNHELSVPGVLCISSGSFTKNKQKSNWAQWWWEQEFQANYVKLSTCSGLSVWSFFHQLFHRLISTHSYLYALSNIFT